MKKIIAMQAVLVGAVAGIMTITALMSVRAPLEQKQTVGFASYLAQY